jgi:hypothetical protein
MFTITRFVGVVSVAAIFALGGCASTSSEITFHPSGLPHHEHPHQDWWSYQFVYHPHAQVYFEPYTRMFFWNEDGYWMEGRVLPSHITVDPHHAKVVHLKTPVPHAQHLTVVASAGPAYNVHAPSPWPGMQGDFALTQVSLD